MKSLSWPSALAQHHDNVGKDKGERQGQSLSSATSGKHEGFINSDTESCVSIFIISITILPTNMEMLKP